ncbi:MAG TPA: hypothetical protein VEA69_17610 [Tepidisphaeraceae bacterium]|nr:hypothetical protein [Tepidisphaeraceae bacterium]
MPLIDNTNADTRLSGLERFLERWYGTRKPEFGHPPTVLDQLQIPGVLRRFYAFAGRWPPNDERYSDNRFCRQDRFLPLARQAWGSVYRDGSYFVFMAENQGVWEAATLTHGDDAGVWVSVDGSHRTDRPTWRQLKCTLSEFLVTFVLQECVMGSLGAAGEGILERFESAGCTIELVCLDGEYAWKGDRRSYYLIDSSVLLYRETGDAELYDDWYGYETKAGEDLLRRLNLPVQT